MSDEKPKSLRHSLAALDRWAGTDPDERTRHMAELSRMSAAKRAAERAAREANGDVLPKKRRTRSVEPLPPIADLLPIMETIQRDRASAGQSELAVDPLMREAALRVRRSLAESTYRAMRGDS